MTLVVTALGEADDDDDDEDTRMADVLMDMAQWETVNMCMLGVIEFRARLVFVCALPDRTGV